MQEKFIALQFDFGVWLCRKNIISSVNRWNKGSWFVRYILFKHEHDYIPLAGSKLKDHDLEYKCGCKKIILREI